MGRKEGWEQNLTKKEQMFEPVLIFLEYVLYNTDNYIGYFILANRNGWL
jgi:hypothetical protein